MAFEELRPKSLFPEPGDITGSRGPFAPLNPVRDPIVNNIGDTTDEDVRRFGLDNPPDDSFDLAFPSDEDYRSTPSAFAKSDDQPGLKPGAFQNIGVNWENKERSERTFTSTPGFYEVDYDPTGKKAEKSGLGTGVLAANVFGRQFSRAELEKDDEGRRLLTLMEKQRTGSYREEGFWSGLSDFSDLSGSYKKSIADIPFIGWMVDAGSTIGETIDMSKTMKKLQNGEQVSDHEALAVRRYMLQQQMESERGIGYTAGSLVHSSIPFMFEMALSSTMIAGAVAAGAAVGGPVGAIIAGAGAVLFGGGTRLLTKAGRASLAAAKVAPKLVPLATRTAEQGFDRAMTRTILEESSRLSGTSAKELVRETRGVARDRALEALGRDAMIRAGRTEAEVATMSAKDAIQFAKDSGVGGKALRERTKYETLHSLADTYQKYFDTDIDAKIARYMFVEGDVVNSFDRGFEEALKTRLLGNTVTKDKSYFQVQRLLRQKFADFTKDPNALQSFADDYVEGFLKGAKGEAVGGLDMVKDSMSRVLGNIGVSNTYAGQVAKEMASRAARSFELMYGGDWLGANGATRFARWVGDGALDGLLRWDTSIFGGVGTLARSGTALGGKMNVLKEAMKVAFVEAPVRGAMQYVGQMPIWAGAVAATGNNPLDMTVRGQLGIQAQALQTGDKELMDHARAIALGAGAIEYISENAGRGINIAGAGLAAPALNKVLPDFTKDFGSWMSKKITAVFGSEDFMRTADQNIVANAISRRIQARTIQMARKAGTSPTMTVPLNEIRTFIQNRSAKGLTSLQGFLDASKMTERQLLQRGYQVGLNVSKQRAAILAFTANHMLKHGLTPQRFAQVLERVGYDGILSEMAEERYGGFFQGLFGLDERPSDEGFRGRFEAAMEGLFPDRKQLITEAIGFAVPCVTQMSLNTLYSQFGKGVTSQWREAANAINYHMTSTPTLNVAGLRMDEAAAIQNWNDEAENIKTRHFGTKEDNVAKVSGNAEALVSGIASGTVSLGKDNEDLKQVGDASSLATEEAKSKASETMKTLLANKADEILKQSKTAEELEANLQRYDAHTLFGTEGVKAIRNLARRNGMVDSASAALYAETGELGIHMAKGQSLLDSVASARRAPATPEEAAEDISLAMPVVSNDASMIAGETAAVSNSDRSTRVNEFSNDMVGDFVRHLSTLAEAGLRYETNLVPAGSWWQRGLMWMTGVLNAITTGDLSLASRNPVQWAIMDAGLPIDTLDRVTDFKKKSIMYGRQLVIERLAANTHNQAEVDRLKAVTSFRDFDKDMMKEYEEAGRDYFAKAIRDYAYQYLAARNVLSVSKSDIMEQARSVAEKRLGRPLTDADAEEVEHARREIIGVLAQKVVNGAVAYSTHEGFGGQMTTRAAYDMNRAMQNGTAPELDAAVRQLPAFRALHPVKDISGGEALGKDFGGAVGRVGDVDTLMTIPDNPGEWTNEQLYHVLKAMNRPYGSQFDAENRRDAATWLRRIKLAVSHQTPTHVYASDGVTELDATFTYAHDAHGNRVVVTNVYDADGLPVFSDNTSANYAEAVKRMTDSRLQCEMPRVVLMENTSFSSKDATSMALFLLGDRETARRFFRQYISEERYMPPYLRKSGTAWVHDERSAAAKLREELAQMRTDESVKSRVMGDGKADSPFRWGYESVAQKYLETRQVLRNSEDVAARVVLGEAAYTVRTSGLPVGNSLYITSDYFSDGDGEALLRSALSQALAQAMMDATAVGSSHEHVMNVFREMNDAFVAAARDAVADFRTKGDSEKADRIEALLEELHVEPGRVSPDRMAAIAASMIFFTSERGLGTTGNGFLLSPELAYVADRARESKWAPLFFSVVDEALGGNGFFSDTPEASWNGLRPFIEAFSPSSGEIDKARASAVFANGDRKGQLTFAQIRWERSASGAPVLPSVAVEPLTEFDETEYGAYARIVASNCHDFTLAYNASSSEKLTAAKMYQMLKQSDMGGGETAGEPAPEPRPQIRAASVVNVNGVHHTLPQLGTMAPLAAHVIADETAFGIARSLRFLSPELAKGVASPERGRVEARASRDAVVRFLRTRGMRPANINRVLAQTFNAFGADDRVETDLDDDTARDEVNEAVESGEANAELAQSEHASNAVVTSKDLAGLAQQFYYVFPTERSNFTAVLTELADELARNADELVVSLNGDLKAASGMWEWQLAQQFNVFRAHRHGTAESRLGAVSSSFADAALTDAKLDLLIADFHSQGKDTFAFVLSALKGISTKGKRRAQALQQVAQMDQHDVSEVMIAMDTDGSVSMTANQQGTGGRISIDSVRAVATHIVLSPTLTSRHADTAGWTDKHRAMELQAVLQGIRALNNHNFDRDGNDYRETNFSERWGRGKRQFPDGLTGKSTQEFDTIIGPATEDKSALVEKVRGIVSNRRPATVEEHAVLVEFAREFARRYAAVGDAIDYVFGKDNEISRALHSPELARQILGDLERNMESDNESVSKALVAMIIHDFENTGSHETKRGRIVSRLFDWIVSPVLNGAVVEAARAKGSRAAADATGFVHTAVASAVLSQDDLANGVASPDFEHLYYHSNLLVQGAKDAVVAELDRSSFLANPATYSASARSDVTRILTRFFQSLPRSTAKVAGVSRAELGESSNVTAVVPSPEPVQDRIVDKLFSRIKLEDGRTLKEEFLSNGRRFADGSRLVSVCAGAKEGDELVDKSLLSMIVYRANRERFEKRGDSRTVCFELYHGEKPTVLSLQLPWYVAERLLKDIENREAYTRNPVTENLYASVDGYSVHTVSGLTAKDGSPTGMQIDRNAKTIKVDVEHLKDAFGKKGWLTPKRSAPVNAEIESFEDLLRFGLFHEIGHDRLGKIKPGETPFDYETRVNQWAEEQMKAPTDKASADIARAVKSVVAERSERRDQYDAMFSVLADMGGFRHITTKRTQVILSNATAIPGHRDYADFFNEKGELDRTEALFSTNLKTGDKIAPGSHFCLSISGESPTQNMGMYFHWGQIVEGQRQLQSNKNALSQKNHVLSRSSGFLTKGQAHAIGLGGVFGGRTFTTGVFAAQQRRWRRKLERTLGLDDGILDSDPSILKLTEEQRRADPKAAEEYAKVSAAVDAVESFGKHSSMFGTDHETQKCGALAKGCGFYAKENGVIHAKIGGKDVWVQLTKDGKWRGKTDEKAEFTNLSYRTGAEYGGSSYPIALVIPAMMEALKLEKLEEADIYDSKAKTGIESEWIDATGRRSSGTINKSGIFNSFGTYKGDKLSFWRTEDGGYECDYYTREIEAQIMANSDAPSKMSHEHPAATNFQRDVVANARRALRSDSRAAVAVTIARMMPYLVVKADESAFEQRLLERDREYYAKNQAHPNSESVRMEFAMKRNALMAKMMRSYVLSTHAVLCGSGIKCAFTRRTDGTYDISYDYAEGVTQYDKDTFQCARSIPSFARAVMGSNRTYSTMRANVSGDGRFRYGWHVDSQTLHGLADELVKSGGPLEGAYEKALQDLNSVYRAQENGAFTHPDATNVSDSEIRDMATVAALIGVFRDGGRKTDLQQKVREILSKSMFDYTGRHLADNPSFKASAVAFHDLFVDGHFDYAAFECGSHARMTPADANGKSSKTLFLGGSFYSGDRRPSGNFEAASGFARVQAPVDFDAETGAVGPSALYILDPAMGNVQGSDTDGDSTTGTASDGRETYDDMAFFDALRSRLNAISRDFFGLSGTNITRDEIRDGIGARARELFEELYENKKFRKYFDVTTDEDGSREFQLSDKFNAMIGNILLGEQGANYRMAPTEILDENGDLVDIGDLGDREVPNIEFLGASRVSPSVMKTDAIKDGGPAFPTDGEFRDLYRECTGKEPVDSDGNPIGWDDAFKNCINGLTGKVKPDLLRAYDHAMFSAEAADANGARGVMVSIQAAIENMSGYDNPFGRAIAPGLFGDMTRVTLPFVARLDGVSNALFDVVKDLFAPRCGWKKNMLNYMVSRLIGRLEADHEAANGGKQTVPDHTWFFREMVTYARDFHRSSTSVAGLLAKYHAGNNYEGSDPYSGKTTFIGEFNAHAGDRLMRLFLDRDGIAWYGEGSEPDILGHVNGDNVMTGADFFEAFNGNVTRVCRRQLRTITRLLDGDATLKNPQMHVRNIFDAMRVLVPESMAKATSDAEALALAGRVFTVLAGTSKTDSDYSVGADMQAALRGNILFGGEAGCEERIWAAERAITDMERFDTIMEAEDALSADATFQRGGEKVTSLLRKIERSFDRNAVNLDSEAIRMQYAQTILRLDDMAEDTVHPTLVARAAVPESKLLGDLVGTGDPSTADGYRDYLRRNNLVAPEPTASELKWIGAAQFIANKQRASVGRALENLGYMQHLPGAIKLGLTRHTPEELKALMTSDIGRHVSDVVARLVEEAGRGLRIETDSGDLPEAVSLLFRMLRVDPTTGKIDLVAKMGPEDMVLAREGFRALMAYSKPIWSVNADTSAYLAGQFRDVRGFRPQSYPVGAITGSDLADLMRIEIARTTSFDSASELDSRANVGQLFGDEVDEMEQWGAAALRCVETRMLLNLAPVAQGTVRNDEKAVAGFDLFNEARTSSVTEGQYASDWLDGAADIPIAGLARLMQIENLTQAEALEAANMTPFDLLVGMLDGESSLTRAKRKTVPSNPNFRATENQPAPVTSPFMQGKDFALVPRTRINGVQFVVATEDGELEAETLEEAVNWHVGQVAAELMKDERFAGAVAGDLSLARAIASRIEGTGADSNRVFVDKVIRDTLASEYGDRFQQWLVDADALGGESLVDPLALRAIRDALHENAKARPVGEVRPRLAARAGVAREQSITLTRMTRSDFLEYTMAKDPEAYKKLSKNPVLNIRYALEKAFGKWSEKTGVKVERVERRNKAGHVVPVNLIRITRKVVDKNGRHNVTTYVSFGDAIPMNLASKAYMESMLEAINAASTGTKMTMKDLTDMTEAQRLALANSLNLRVLGESRSRSCVTTDALLAMTGLIRLSDAADFYTLFHEYFHQTFEFFRETGICTDTDLAELTARYRQADGSFDEEAAADAFAEYLLQDDPDEGSKLLANGAGDRDKVFTKMKHTAQAFLAGALAYDASGVPVFMKMMISADFSDREMQNAEHHANSELREVEDALLKEDFEFGYESDYTGPEATPGLHTARLAVQNAVLGFRNGTTTAQDVKTAAQRLVEELAKPENRVTFDGVMNLYRLQNPVVAPGVRAETPLERKLKDDKVPAVERVRLFLEESLKRFGEGTLAPEYQPLVAKINNVASWGMNEITPAIANAAEATARRLIRQTAEVLGLDFEEWADDGKTTRLNALGQLLVSDQRIAELALRLIQEGTKELQAAPENASGRRKTHVSAADVVGLSLVTITPTQWGTYAHDQGTAAATLFARAAEDCRARADVEEAAGRTDEAVALRGQAEILDRRAKLVERVIIAVARGEDMTKIVPSAEKNGGTDLYNYVLRYLLDSSVQTGRMNGQAAYKASESSRLGLDYTGKFVQQALDMTARALAVAAVVRRRAQENGVELPAIGAPVALPEDAVEPPAEGVYEPDTVPQIILQSPGSWLASDLQKNFYGSNLRDLITDTSLQSLTEESNRLAHNIIFTLGANVEEGGRLNRIDVVTSRLGTNPDGTTAVRDEFAHKITRVSSVRGLFLGLINFAAETVGETWTRDNVNMVNMALQTVTGMMTGDPVITGYDVAMMSVHQVKRLMGNATAALPTTWEYTTRGNPFSVEAVQNRANGLVNGRRVPPSNLDVLLNRLIDGIGLEALGYDSKNGCFRQDGIYCKILGAFIEGAYAERTETNPDGSTSRRGVTDAEYKEDVLKKLRSEGFAATSTTGKTVITIPTDVLERVWNASEAKRKLLAAGRSEAMLSLRHIANVIAADANRLHQAASKSRFLRDHEGACLSSAARSGLFFEAGTGFHRLVSDTYANARARFLGRPSPDEVLRHNFDALQITIDRDERTHVRYMRDSNNKIMKDRDGKPIVAESWRYGDAPAFERNADGFLKNVSTRKIQYLARLLGLGSRLDGAALKAFLDKIDAGQYKRENATGPYGFDIDPDMTVADFDRLLFNVVSTLLTEESLGRKTSLTVSDEDGGLGYGDQDLIDLAEMNRRLGDRLMADVSADDVARGRVCTLSDMQAFRSLGLTGSAKTAPERLVSMAESIVHAERFRGCLAQMLTSVGSDGLPNYVVNPTDAAADLAPDQYWQAVARFLHDRIESRVRGYGLPAYDPGVTGLENVRRIALVIKNKLAESKGKHMPFQVHAIPPDEIAAQNMFSDILCKDDGDSDDVSILNKTTNRHLTGSEAAGYMKQLFGAIYAPSQWAGWRRFDRIMSYSKAMSVNMSSFFAFATRFESPVAAVGLMNTVMGYRNTTAEGMRKLSKWLEEKHPEVAKALHLESDTPYLKDFLDSITSDDPAIRDMRMLLDMIGMPLTDSVQNPMNDRQGNIDSDIKRVSEWATDALGSKVGAEIRGVLRAALHNPSEYAFSNVLNGVKMAVVAQTLRRLRRECEDAGRPFDPVRELRRHSAYINAEIGGIQAERYAWLTPGMQRFLRLAMFSYNWTVGAWTAGTGEVVSDVLFGGHNTTADMRRNAFVRWLRMLGIIKVGVPMVTQFVIRALAGALTKFGIVAPDPDDPDDKDPLGIENMPYWCFNNESKIGALSIDITPILKLCGRSETLKDLRLGRGAWPWIGAASGAALMPVVGGIGGFLTGGLKGAAHGVAANTKVWSTLLGMGAGAGIGAVVPAYDNVGRGANSSGGRRYYMHFGKQSDEFWRWFTDAHAQMMNKMSIPTQKVVEALFGTTGASTFGSKFTDRDLVDRIFTTSLDPNESALANFFTAFVPFSCASVGAHPDAGVFGMMGPVQMGLSQTLGQKRIKARLMEFMEGQPGVPDIWAHPKNKRDLRLLCSDIFREAKLNGYDPRELLQSAFMEVCATEYAKLMTCLPKSRGDSFDAKRAQVHLRALYRVNAKIRGIRQSLKNRYRRAGVDWTKQENEPIRRAVLDFLHGSRRNPWAEPEEDFFESYFSETADPRSTRQAGKGGDAFRNFLATDEVPETLFGVPIVEANEEDMEFFRKNPTAAGFYDMGDGDDGDEPTPPDDHGGRRADKAEGTPERVGIGGDRFDAKEFMDHINATKGTERDVYRELYRLAPEGTADRVYDETMKARIAMYETDSRKKLEDLYAAGKIGLEDVPILEEGAGPSKLPDGTVLDTSTTPWDEAKERSRKSLNRAHPGEIRIVGQAALVPGSHVQEKARLNRTGSNWRTGHEEEYDRGHRSAAYPGDSTLVLHSIDAAPEELIHLMTRSKAGELQADKAQAKAIEDADGGLNRSMAYYGFGNKSERRDAMSALKVAMTVMGKDARDPKQREEFLRTLDEKDFPVGTPDAAATNKLALPDNAKAVLKAMQLLRYKKMKKRDLNESEKEADKDLSSDYMWSVVSTGDGTRNAIRAAMLGGDTKEGK